MKKTSTNLMILNAIFSVMLILSNIVAGRITKLGNIEVSAAVFAFAITFLMTDIIGELWGKEEAKKTVWIGFFIQLGVLAYILLILALPPADYLIEYDKSFRMIFSQSTRVVIASLIVYIIAQLNDLFVFHKLKDLTKGKHKWLRNNGSTVISQFINTFLFILLAFYGTVPSIWNIFISQYLIVVIIALIDTPLFYLFTRESKNIRR